MMTALVLAVSVPGLAQSLPPTAERARLYRIDSTTDIAPRLPSPSIGDDAPPLAFLQAATRALAAGRDGEAQEAIERAESRALNRSVRPSQARVPDARPLMRKIAAARAALSAGDRGEAMKWLQAALRDPSAPETQ